MMGSIVARYDIPPKPRVREDFEVAAHGGPEVFAALDAKRAEPFRDVRIVEHVQQLAVQPLEIRDVEASGRRRDLREVEFGGEFVARS